MLTCKSHLISVDCCVTLTKAYKAISELKKARKLAVEKVFVGGGGNAAGQCREMSLRWIRQGVEQMVTTEKWELGVQWERVNLA